MNPLFSNSANLLAAAGPGSEWSVSYEGISPGLAFVIFAVIALGTVFAYLKFAPGASRWRKIVMMVLRIAAALVLVTLLAKPVINLTVHDPVRQPLAVLVDGSESIQFQDRRERVEDLKRAGIATGMLGASGGLDQSLPGNAANELGSISRKELLTKLAANEKLDLWPKLAGQADLAFYQFGRNAVRVPFEQQQKLKAEDAARLFGELKAEETSTAIGEAVRQVLQEPRPQPIGAMLLVTDGANNSGSSPIEAAQIAKEQGVPLFIYGVGVTSPRDLLVREVTAQKLAFVEERLEVRARVASQSMEEKTLVASLKANGETVDEKEITLGGDREQEVIFHVAPQVAGELKLEVSLPVQPDEAGKNNNTASTSVRVTDSKFNVLLIEQEPRWDFRYLLDYLERDPRLKVRCAMIDGEPGLSQGSESTFLPAVPNTREGIFASQVLILGDVKPADLGRERMEIIADWVEAGGGIIFLAGSHFNPGSYVGTPLEPLLPVVAEPMRANDIRQRRERSPFPLELTAAGRRSPYLRMASGDEENLKIWEGFPGVRWVAPVLRAKPGAEVLLVDSRASSSGRHGKMPVFAMQSHGSGKCVYFGTDETYRWRSKAGQKYYSILWGQIMQSLALQLLDSASALTQLKTDRVQYRSGDRVTISGKAYEEGYVPLMLPSLEGVLTIQEEGQTTTQTRPLTLNSIDRNSFRAEFNPTQPGKYTFHTLRDPEGKLHFEVVDSNEEKLQTSLDATLLKEMAGVAGGPFLREEELDLLPGWISAATTKVDIHRKVELYRSPWLLAALIALFSSEWLWRRLNRLK